MFFDSATLDNLQIFVFETPYDYFEKDLFARQVLCDSWAMKLKGYKSYFPYGVLPIDHLDFISTHIICTKKDVSTDKYIPIMGVKNLTVATCDEFKLDFPIYKHLFCGEVEKYQRHIHAIEKWVYSKNKNDIAYSMGFTIEPSLEKEFKMIMIELGWAIFYLYYNYAKINHVIHGVSKTFKLAEKSNEIGFNFLQDQIGRIPSVKTKSYNNVESEIMTLELNNLKDKFILEAFRFEELWNNRITYERELIEKEFKRSA